MSSKTNIRQQEMNRLRREVEALQTIVEGANMNEARAMNNTAKKAAKQIKNNAMSTLQSRMVALGLMQRPVAAPVPSPPSASGYTYNIKPKSTGGRRRSHKKSHKKRRSTRRR